MLFLLSNVRKVGIEIHNFCNRKCVWCTNYIEERKEPYTIMPEEVFVKILKELKDNNFGANFNGGIFTFEGFHEPLYDVELLKQRVSLTKEVLCKTAVSFSSNGDFLTKDSISGIELSSIFLSDYDCKGMDYCKEKLKSVFGEDIEIYEDGSNIYAVTPNINKIRYKVN